MSDLEDLEFDPQEYADQLGYSDELGRGDYSDPNVIRAESPEARRRGVTRRELLVKGGLGAAALSASGALAGSAAAKAGRGEASDPYTRHQVRDVALPLGALLPDLVSAAAVRPEAAQVGPLHEEGDGRLAK